MGRWIFLLAALAMYATVLPAHAAAGRDPGTYFFDQTLGNFHDELATARAEGKKGIMLFFEQAECPFCHYMKQNVLNQPEVQAYYKKNFLIFSADINGDVDMADFSGKIMKQKDFAFKENRVRATPVIAFYDLNGKQVVKYIGATNGVQEFMLLGKYAAGGMYRKTTFIKYKREQLKQLAPQ